MESSTVMPSGRLSSYAEPETGPYKPFRPATRGESRSPCPAINALANHSYIPHNGKSVTLWQLIRAIHEVYLLSYPLACLMSIGGIILCGNIFSLSLDLHDLAKHGKIEHDGSLAHPDAPAGHRYASIIPDWRILKNALFGQDDKGGMRENGTASPVINQSTLVHARARRDRDLLLPLSRFQRRFAFIEVVLLGHTLTNTNGQIPQQWIYEWMIEERLPQGWPGPQESLGLLTARSRAKDAEKEAAIINEKGTL